MNDSIDIVFVTNSINHTLWSMTRNAIRTARENAGMQIGQIVVVEECLYAREQLGTKTLYYDFEFNYNKCLNYGFLSVSPSHKHTFNGMKVGYEIGVHVLGWCIIMDRVVMEKIGDFDTPVNFWYSDDVYAEQLKAAGIKHALAGSSRVKHLTSVSLLKVVKGKSRMDMQKGQEKIFEQYRLEKYGTGSGEIKREV